MPIDTSRRLMTTAEAAEYLGVSESLLHQWRGKGVGPRFTKMGPRMVRYQQSDLDDYCQDLPTYQSNAEAQDASV